MPNETRVNLRHLLEDIRDSYALPIEEVIITELTANALDSKATHVDFTIDPARAEITCLDNGQGMRRPAFREYHNIAATTKERGSGIGFAGVGAKLSLLIAESVTTETRGGRGSRAATEWRLTHANRAPWKFIPASGLVAGPRGTAVRIALKDQASQLLEPSFIAASLQKHFQPLLSQEMQRNLLKFIYKHGIILSVNGTALTASEADREQRRDFFVHFGSRRRRPIGYGYLVQNASLGSGIQVSTFGKVIKRGWEWLGILPKTHDRICGAVEVPGLAEILTTNKTDFLNDTASLKKYYRYRKAIQEAIVPILRDFGEDGIMREDTAKGYKALQRDIENALDSLVGDFPEIQPLLRFARRRGVLMQGAGKGKEQAVLSEHLLGVDVSPEEPAGKAAEQETPAFPVPPPHSESGAGSRASGAGRKREPGIKIGFEDDASSAILGRLVEDTAWINTAHPAWKKAKNEGFEAYHILHTVAWILSSFIESEHSPHEFVSRFLSAWGTGDKRAQQLFRMKAA